jgi:hypothetical protein
MRAGNSLLQLGSSEGEESRQFSGCTGRQYLGVVQMRDRWSMDDKRYGLE